MCRSHRNLTYGRGGETKFRRTFFCLLFFQEKKKQKGGSDGCVVPTGIWLTGAEAKRSFAKSSFASFSFKKRRSGR